LYNISYDIIVYLPWYVYVWAGIVQSVATPYRVDGPGI